MKGSLVIRNVEIEGRPGLDVCVEAGLITAVGRGLGRGRQEIDGHGGALLPGLADHHIHLLATAARNDSIDLTRARDAAAVAERITTAATGRPDGAWIRAIGYHERMAGDLTARALDRLAPRHRLRVQHQTGSLWVLNSLALQAINADTGPPCVERDAQGLPTGRIWRGDAWLSQQVGRQAPPLAPLGRELAALGITAVTDASVTTDADAAAIMAEAHRTGALPQRLTLMSGGPLTAPPDAAFAIGPRKILLDDHALPELDEMIDRIGQARGEGRPVAVHCVAAGELALTLAAFEAAGARAGDRIEHGGVIPEAAIAAIRLLGLTVVTQPAFIRERGDRYLEEVDPRDRADLYRCASLRAAGAPVAGSSDAPYASTDPWLGMAAAMDRRTRAKRRLGGAERLDLDAALGLYLGAPGDPGGPRRRVVPGAPADLCLLRASIAESVAIGAGAVRATLIGGEAVFGGEALG